MKKLLFAFAISLATSSHAQEPATKKDLEHYLVHICTDSAGKLFLASTLAAVPILMFALNGDKRPLLLPIVGLYADYKIPQWTDTYALGLNTKRSTKQNLFSFFVRPIPWVGSIISEYCITPESKNSPNITFEYGDRTYHRTGTNSKA